MNRLLLPLSYLFLLSCMLMVTLHWWEKPQVLPTMNTSSTTNHPSAFMDDIVSIQFDKKGQIAHQLQAPLLLHYETSDRTEVNMPKITLPTQDASPWYISAEHGQTSGNQKAIDLDTHVHMIQPASKQTGERHITTDTLRYWPNRHFAQTRDHVTMTEPGTTMHSVGAKAYFQENRIQLLEKAQVFYSEPKTKPQVT